MRDYSTRLSIVLLNRFWISSDSSILFNRKDEKRTLEEAEKLHNLQDKNIVRYYDSGFAKFPDWEEWKEWLQKTSRLYMILKCAYIFMV